MTDFIYSIQWLAIAISAPSSDDVTTRIKESIIVYRSIIMLNELQNSVLGSLFIPSAKLAGILLVYISVVAATLLRAHINFFILTLFLMYLNILTIVIVCGAVLMSQVYSISKTFHKNIATVVICKVSYSQEKILLRKTLKSLPVVKSRIGQFYNMEGEAKLTLLDNVNILQVKQISVSQSVMGAELENQIRQHIFIPV